MIYCNVYYILLIDFENEYKTKSFMYYTKGALSMKEQTKIKLRILFNRIIGRITKQRMGID